MINILRKNFATEFRNRNEQLRHREWFKLEWPLNTGFCRKRLFISGHTRHHVRFFVPRLFRFLYSVRDSRCFAKVNASLTIKSAYHEILKTGCLHFNFFQLGSTRSKFVSQWLRSTTLDTHRYLHFRHFEYLFFHWKKDDQEIIVLSLKTNTYSKYKSTLLFALKTVKKTHHKCFRIKLKYKGWNSAI